MGSIEREHFYQRLQGAPLAACGFFESVITHFDRDNMVDVHFTDTHGGDLRLAIPGDVLNRKIKRNFATMYWQRKKNLCLHGPICRLKNSACLVLQMRPNLLLAKSH